MRWLPVIVVALSAHRVCADPLPIRGWLDNGGGSDRVLALAKAYGINHLELGQGNLPVNGARRRGFGGGDRLASVEDMARRAAALGIKTYVWSHEIDTSPRRQVHDLPLDPATEAGRTFWEGRRDAYRRVLKACPSLSGIVLMFGSAPTEVDVKQKDPFWTKLNSVDRLRFITNLVSGVVVGEFKKRLFVRDFNHGPEQLANLVTALRDRNDIIVESKVEPQDFQLFYPNSAAIGAIGTTSQIVEIDLFGEYWGRSTIPVSLVRYLHHRIQHGAWHGVKGALGRIGGGRGGALGTPNEINVYAYSRLLENPDASVDSIYDGWLERRYHLKPGTDDSRRLRTILERTYEMAKSTFYTLGFWTPKVQNSVPSRVQDIDNALRGKSLALWNPLLKPEEERLLHPDSTTVRAVLEDKARGIALADANVKDLAALKSALQPADYAQLDEQLRRAADWARMFASVSSAYWRVKLNARSPGAPEASVSACDKAIAELDAWAERIQADENGHLAALSFQTGPLRSLAADLRRIMAARAKTGTAAQAR